MQSSLERLPPTAEGSGSRDPLSDIMWRQTLTGDLLQVPLSPLRDWGTPKKRGKYDGKRWRTPRKHDPPNLLNRAHRGLQRVRQQTWGLHESATGHLHACYSC